MVHVMFMYEHLQEILSLILAQLYIGGRKC